MKMIGKELVDMLSDPDSRDALFGKPGTLNFPIGWQVAQLGLDDKKLEDFKNKKILDLGCGNGNLVKYLIKKGIKAEGISPEAPEGDYFMRQKVKSVHPLKGSIPRKDENYNIVLANSINTLTLAFSSYREALRKQTMSRFKGDLGSLKRLDADLKKMDVEAHMMMLETLRVLKKGGRFICSPYLDKLQEHMSFEFSKGNYRIEKEPIEFVLQMEEMMKKESGIKTVMQSFGHNINKQAFPEFFRNRMILYKE